jgi:AbrB family looped-hinge helix DNA binding protein
MIYLILPVGAIMAVVTTSSRGQIVIPKDIRKRLGISPGRKLLIKAEGDVAVITPMPVDPVESFCGIFKEGPSLTDALMEERQKDLDREAKKTAG